MKKRGFMKHLATAILSSSFLAALPAPSFAADYTVGFISSLNGPVASLGIPYRDGIDAAYHYQAQINGRNIKLIKLDDNSDTSAAALDARKLINQEKVDVLIATAGSPQSHAVAVVANEEKTPLIALAHAEVPGPEGAWTIITPQPPDLMAEAVIARMKQDGVKTVGYIGFSDNWGDQVYEALQKIGPKYGVSIVANERYARTDDSVTGQMLKILAKKPDGVMTGTSGTPAALPFLALKERGYKGRIYGMHSLLNEAFTKLAGDSIEGLICPAGPESVAEQLPADNPMRKMTDVFRSEFEKVTGKKTKNPFAAYSFDSWLLFVDAAKRVPKEIEPGTPQFRDALMKALTSTKDVVGTMGIYNFKPGERYGVDKRAAVLVEYKKGDWVVQH